MKLWQVITILHSGKYGRMLLHIIFWACFFPVCSFIAVSTSGPGNTIIPASIFRTLAAVAVFYAFVYYIWPQLVHKKRYLKAVLMMACTGCIYILVIHFRDLQQMLFAPQATVDPVFVITKRVVSADTLYQLVFFICIPVSLKIIYAWAHEIVPAVPVRPGKTWKSPQELFQLSPGLVLQTVSKAQSVIAGEQWMQSPALSGLSGFLQYQSEASVSTLFPLEKEIQVICNYIEIERPAFSKTKVRFYHHRDRYGYHLPALLFMPLIENAFRFHSCDDGEAFINIELSILNGLLQLEINNSISSSLPHKVKGGAGLTTFLRRLQQQFPGRNAYQVNCYNGVYSVHVSLKVTS